MSINIFNNGIAYYISDHTIILSSCHFETTFTGNAALLMFLLLTENQKSKTDICNSFGDIKTQLALESWIFNLWKDNYTEITHDEIRHCMKNVSTVNVMMKYAKKNISNVSFSRCAILFLFMNITIFGAILSGVQENHTVAWFYSALIGAIFVIKDHLIFKNIGEKN